MTRQLVEQTLLAPAALSVSQLEHALGGVLSRQVDYADIYLQHTESESWRLEDNKIKDADYAIDAGFGLRALSGEKTGFAYADSVSHPLILDAAHSVKSIAQHRQDRRVACQSNQAPQPFYAAVNPFQAVTDQEKVDLLHELNDYIRKQDPRIQEVMISLSAEHDLIYMLNTDGQLVTDVRPLVNLSIRVIASEDGRIEQASGGGGSRTDYRTLMDREFAKGYADKAVRQVLQNLSAKPAPAGSMPVVLGPGWPAVLLHEAVGHGLEADFNRKKTSVFTDKIGEQVATSCCTVVDDGTLPDRRGSLNIDDEGSNSERTVLIENGVLKNYMQDKLNARLMGMQPTGNGRRESYASCVLPRMTNTYMLPGEHNKEDIIASVEKGIYAVDFSGGQVDITSGSFVFCASEAYLIEKGKVTAPIKGATLIGSGLDTIQKISMVGDDLALDSGVGTCGKSGQSVPVGVGQPTLKIDEITVGGTQL